MATSLSFKKLKVWKKETEVAMVNVYGTLADSFGKNHALRTQMNSITGSIMDNHPGSFQKLLTQISDVDLTSAHKLPKGSNTLKI